MDKQVVISVRTILITLGLILSGYVIYRLFDTIVIMVISLLFVIAMEPGIAFFMRQKVLNRPLSRTVSVIFTYAILIFFLSVFSTIVFPPLIIQVQKLILTLPDLLQGVPLPKSINLESVIPNISSISNNLINFSLYIFSNVATFLTVLMLSVYLSLDWENVKKRFADLFHDGAKKKVQNAIEEIEVVVGNWIKGQAVLMFSIGFSSFLGLYLLDVDYPLALGLISGILEFIPVVGPVISAIIAATVAFTQEPLKGLAVLLLFFIIQQVENNFLVPKIMGKVSGYGPLAILCVLLVGSNFFGLLGAILGVPVFMITMIIVRKFFAGSQ